MADALPWLGMTTVDTMRRMRFATDFALPALCFLAVSTAFAQAPAPSSTIILPQQLVAGQPATLAVLASDGRLAAGVDVEFSGGKRVTTDATGRAAFRAPDAPGVMIARLAGASVSATATVVAAAGEAAEGVQVLQSPRLVMLGEPFGIRGTGFRGEADANRVHVNDKPAAVLAASPAALVVLPASGTSPGLAQFVVEVQGRSPGPVPIRLVAVDLVFEKGRLATGEKAPLAVRVRGSEQPLELEICNVTPGVVRLTNGDVQRVHTGGGPENAARVEMEGVRAGDFSISARLVPAVTGLPDTETARERLVAARAQAPQDWASRVDKLIAQLAESPQNALRVRTELEKMMAEMPAGEFGRLLESAWRALLPQ